MAKTVRDINGLALSSRNNYLSKEQARVAKNIYKSLKILKKIIKNGEDVSKALNQQKNFLLNEGFTKIEYLEIRTQDLKKSILPHHRSRIFIAAKIENIRLIDNLLI
jgi:pantoate--beta-alanine ligase